MVIPTSRLSLLSYGENTMRSLWVVLEIHESKASNAIACEDYDAAVEVFSRLVSEYGVEPYEEMINTNIFITEDNFVVQMLELR